MDFHKRAKETRTEKAGWDIVAKGDNGFDMLQFNIKVKDIAESSKIADAISSMIMKYERPDDVFYTQISLRDWRVEVILALPTNSWGTAAQEEFATSMSEIYNK